MWIRDPDGSQIVEIPAGHPCAVTRERRHRQDDEFYAADPGDPWVKSAATQRLGWAPEPVRNREAPGCRPA
jgi:hypothetical protein